MKENRPGVQSSNQRFNTTFPRRRNTRAAATGRGRHRIEPASAPRMAATEAPQAQPAAPQCAVGLDRLEEVLRAGRLEAAPAARPHDEGQHRGDQKLVAANQEAEHHSIKIAARVPSAIYSERRESPLARAAVARTTSTIHRPGTIRGWESRTISRSRRRSRLRTTAFPTRREVTSPKRVEALSL